jgi:hypothetical protein
MLEQVAWLSVIILGEKKKQKTTRQLGIELLREVADEKLILETVKNRSLQKYI